MDTNAQLAPADEVDEDGHRADSPEAPIRLSAAVAAFWARQSAG